MFVVFVLAILSNIMIKYPEDDGVFVVFVLAILSNFDVVEYRTHGVFVVFVLAILSNGKEGKASNEVCLLYLF